MSVKNRPNFEGGRNIAMKTPAHVFDQTVIFYRDVLGFPVIEEDSGSIVFEFGSNRMWLDRVDQLSQAEIWLEITTDDIPAAAGYFHRQGTIRRDEIENLPEGFEGFWICSPADVIHLVALKEEQ